MANDYVNIDELKSMLPDTSWGSTYDVYLTALASRASRAIDRFTNRAAGAYFPDLADKTYYYDGPGRKLSQIGDIRSGSYEYDNRLGGVRTPSSQAWIDEIPAAPTSVWMALTGDLKNYTQLVASDYIMWPYNAPARGFPYQRMDLDLIYGHYKLWYSFRKCIKVVGRFGYSLTPPDDIKQAVAIQAIRWFKRGQQAYQDAGGIGPLGQLIYVRQLDPDIEAIIMHYRNVAI